MRWKSIADAPVKDRRVVTRVDINVPLKEGSVSDATRILRIVPTVKSIREMGGACVLIAHLGRPKGIHSEEHSLAQVVSELEAAIGISVQFCSQTVGQEAQSAAERLEPGEVLLMENLRFHTGETDNSPEFASKLASLGQIYCNDAFSVSHRAHASVVGITSYLPCFAGKLLDKELNALNSVLTNPTRPVAAIVGGAKVSTKIEILTNLSEKVDYLVIGGGMANSFYLAKGYEVGNSLVETGMLKTAKTIMRRAGSTGCEILLPKDVVIAPALSEDADWSVVPASNCPGDRMILDSGPQAVEHIIQVLENSKTLIWNGPVGAFETRPFDRATNRLARRAAELTEAGALTSVAGGGDTLSALNRSDSAKSFTYVSTAGGAFLEWLEGKTLPGLKALAEHAGAS